MQLKDKIKISMLNQLYGNLLTKNQKQCIEDYYNKDLTLTEIAENINISRQGVRDVIKKGENRLLEYEEKLGIMSKTLKQEKKIEKVLLELTKIQTNSSDKEIASILNSIKKELNCLV